MEATTEYKEKIAEIEKALHKAKAKLKAEKRDVKFYAVVSLICAILITFDYTGVLNIATWLNVTLWIVGIFFIMAILGTDLYKGKAEIESQLSRKRIFLGLPESTETSKYFDKLVKINVDNLAEYYALVKVHTSQSFRVSLIVGVIGFFLLIGGLALGFQFKKYSMISYIAAGSGVIVEFISGVLFYLYNKTVIQLKDYHDSLINVQNVLLSFKLIEDTEDEKLKADMISKMIEFLVKK
jgi:hypothetical protein